MSFASALYRGEVMHARHDAAARRAFRYPVYIVSLDLAELSRLDRELRLFSVGRRNLFGFDARDYGATLSPSRRDDTSANRRDDTPTSRRDDTPTSRRDDNATSRRADRPTPSPARGGGAAELLAALETLRAANGIPRPHSTRLITNLRVAGYTFNPVSFFLDYDANGAFTSVIAEVNNTYGGRLRYVLGPSHRLSERFRAHQVGFRHRRELFVSPFLHGDADYDFWFDAPLDGSRLAIEMHVHSAGARRLTARVSGTRTELSDRALLAAAVRYPLMTAQVIGLIHYEALKMRFAGVPYRRPGGDHRPLVP